MSHSPIADRIGGDQQEYIEAWRDVNQLLRSGRSFSGRERNCAYLNLNGQSFANVSAVSGFDSAQDGRAIAMTDWDLDGDLDVWITNRNSPRVRLLINRLTDAGRQGSGNYLSLLLVATSKNCNRDAIGARVELRIAGGADTDGEEVRLLRTVRAGDGYLSQSSRWLHFGLGEAQLVNELVVTWPDGKRQAFQPPEVNGRFRLVQSTTDDRQARVSPERVTVAAASGVSHASGAGDSLPDFKPASTLATQNWLTRPVLLPPLPYTLFNGTRSDAAAGSRPRPLLLTLWSSSCATCAAELSDWARHVGSATVNTQLVGADIVLLSVDSLEAEASTTDSVEVTTATQRLLQRMTVPFDAGMISAATLHKLQLVHNQVYDHDRPLPVPTTLLVDIQGRLAAIYKGRVSVERLARDIRRLQQPEKDRLTSGLPRPGRWVALPGNHGIPGLINTLAKHGYDDDALVLAKRLDSTGESGKRFQAGLKVERAARLAREGAVAEAKSLLTEALRHDPLSARAHSELGTILGRQNQLAPAIRHLKEAVRLNGDKLPDAHLNLAVALRKTNRGDEAIGHLERALQLDPKLKAAHITMALIYGQQDKMHLAAESFERAVRLDPRDTQTRFNLALALVKLQDPNGALRQLYAALEHDPDLPIALTMASELLSKQGRIDEAVELLRGAVKRKPQAAPLHGILAASLEQIGEPAEALAHYREAERLQRGNLRALMRIAWIMSTDPNAELRNGKLAVRYARRADKKQPNDVAVLDVLAAAHAEAGDFEQAVRIGERAIAVAQQKGQSRDAAVVEARLSLYRNDQPYRSPARR